jgi:predicted nucleic acid-binding protein
MKVVLDTNVLIQFLRNPADRTRFESRLERPLLYMSSIVAMELLAGCTTRREQSALAGFLKPFEKAGRVITPDHTAFWEAGRVLAAIGTEGIGKEHLRRLSNDVLIGISAARAGVALVTKNARDFERIARWSAIRWVKPD